MFFRILNVREQMINNGIRFVFFIFILIVLFIIQRLTQHKQIAEYFVDERFFSNYLKENIQDGENLIKFCKVLRDLDNQTDETRLMKKINKGTLEKGEKEIKRLLDEIYVLQNDDEKKQIEQSNFYKYKTHTSADKQRKLINAVKQRLTSDTKVDVKML